MRFDLIYKIWAFQVVRDIGPWGERTGLSFWAGAKGPGVSLSLRTFFLGLVSGFARLFFLTLSVAPPALGYGEHEQGLYHFLNQVRLPRGLSGLVWLGLCRRQPSYDNDEFSTFALTSSSSFSFFREHPLTISIVPRPPPPPPPPPLVLKLFTFLLVQASFV